MTLNFIFYVFSWFKNYVKDCPNKMLSADYGSSGKFTPPPQTSTMKCETKPELEKLTQKRFFKAEIPKPRF